MNQTQLRIAYANKRRQSTFKTTKRVVWKSKSRHIA